MAKANLAQAIVPPGGGTYPETLAKLHPGIAGHDSYGVSLIAIAGHKVVLSCGGVKARLPFAFVLTLDFSRMFGHTAADARLVLRLETKGRQPVELVAPLRPVGAMNDPATTHILRFTDFELVPAEATLTGGPSWSCLWCLLPIAACAVGCLPFFFPPWVQYLACIAACAAEPEVFAVILACLENCGMFESGAAIA
jgi:hypothetical protein